MKFQISKGKNRNRFIHRERLKKLNLYNLFGDPPPKKKKKIGNLPLFT